MTPNSSNDYPTEEIKAVETPHGRRWLHKTLAIVIPILIIGAGIVGASYFIKTSPKAAKKKPQKTVPLVKVEPAGFSDEQVVVKAMGTVVPTRQIDLKTSVAGEVIWINPAFTEGGILKAGETVLKIDPADYRLQIVEMQSQVAQAQYDLEVELGYQEVAKREWELISKGKSVSAADENLALRKPHLKNVQAALKAAQSQLEQARKDLERTVIKAPFNAMVSDRQVDIGSQAASQSTLATLTGTDRYWVQVSLPIDRLDWITIGSYNDQSGSTTTIRQGNSDNVWQGNIVRLMGDLDPQGRMARVLVTVDDPLNLAASAKKRQRLILGAYVHAQIEGRKLNQVVRLPRPILHENNTVWILADDNTLSIRPISIIWRDSDSVFADQGIKKGEKIIISDLPVPVEGMEVRLEDDALATGNPKEKKNS